MNTCSGTDNASAAKSRILFWNHFPQETRQSHILLCLLCWSVLSFVLISRFVMGSVQIDGSSMEPTLHDTDRYIVNRLAFLFREPVRGDLVLIRDHIDEDLCVKRIVGVPHDELQFINGKVYVNGTLLQEPYLPKHFQTWSKRYTHRSLKLGPNHFFVLGDNRSNSEDSRSYGPLRRQNILGLVNQ